MTSLKKLKHHLTAAKEYFDEHCIFDCVCRAEYSSACNQGGAVCGYIADALEMIDDELKEDKEEMTNKDSLKADKKELKKLNVEEEKAWICANMRNGSWYCSGYFVLQTAFNNKKIRELGYPTFTEFYLKICEN